MATSILGDEGFIYGGISKENFPISYGSLEELRVDFIMLADTKIAVFFQLNNL